MKTTLNIGNLNDKHVSDNSLSFIGGNCNVLWSNQFYNIQLYEYFEILSSRFHFLPFPLSLIYKHREAFPVFSDFYMLGKRGWHCAHSTYHITIQSLALQELGATHITMSLFFFL